MPTIRPSRVLSNPIVAGLREVGARSLTTDGFRKAEVKHLDDTLDGDLDVRRLQVPMNDPVLMCRFQRLGDLPRDRQRVSDWYRASCDQIGQRLTLYQFHDQPAHAAGFFKAVNDGDVGMIQRCQHARLALESTDPFWIRREGSRQHLDGHLAPELGVPRPVDLAHPTRAEQRLNLVGAELLSDERRADISFHRFRRRLHGGCLEKAFRGSLEGEQRFNFLPQRQVAGTLLL